MIRIQYMDNGTWRTVRSVMNVPTYINEAMKATSGQFDGHRVRAIDENDRLVDIL